MTRLAHGTVDATPIGGVVYAVAAKRITGTLRFEHAGREHWLGYANGNLVAAHSPDPGDHIGRIALKAGLANSTQMSTFLGKSSAAPDRDPAEILAEVAKLSDSQVAALKQRAVAMAAARPFALAAATYELTDEPPPSSAPPVAIQWIIFRGTISYFDVSRLQRELGPLSGKRVSVGEAQKPFLETFGFAPDHEPIVSALAAPIGVVDLIKSTCETDPRPALAVLYSLYYTGCLELVDETGERRAAPSPKRSLANIETLPPGSGQVPTVPPLDDELAESPAVTTEPESTTAAPAPGGGHSRVDMTAGAPKLSKGTAGKRRFKGPRSGKSAAEIDALIAQKLRDLEADVDHFALLGVSRGASGVELQKAYFELAKVLHPDRLSAAGVTADPVATQKLFARINIAFGVLTNSGKREHYNKVLAAGGERAYRKQQEEAEKKAAAIFAAEDHFRAGEMALRRGLHKDALSQFEKAVTLNPDEGEHHAYYGWAKWLSADDRDAIYDEIKRVEERALKLSPKCAPAMFFLGQLAKHRKDKSTAESYFEQVLELLPNHNEARLELRLLRSRS